MAEKEGLILAVDKPSGWTSFDVVNKLRGALKWKGVGHAGTLDPAATGLLIVLCGAATKRQSEFMLLPKEYRATIRFGLTTSSDDLDGTILTETPIVNWDEAKIQNALSQFSGEIQQVPPAVSAIKIDGKRSYKIARQGKVPDLAARTVTIYSCTLEQIKKPDIIVTIHCSSGTYIRSIARDLGATLGWGGVLAELRRTAIGPYRADKAFNIKEVLLRIPDFHGA